VESDTWEGRKNLENTKEAIQEFKKEYRRDMKDVVQQEYKERTFQRGELPVSQMVTYLICDLRKEFFKRVQARFR